ncbi:hypothetical protein PMIN06_008761 [Paraphaeosphaeria minitans]
MPSQSELLLASLTPDLLQAKCTTGFRSSHRLSSLDTLQSTTMRHLNRSSNPARSSTLVLFRLLHSQRLNSPESLPHCLIATHKPLSLLAFPTPIPDILQPNSFHLKLNPQKATFSTHVIPYPPPCRHTRPAHPPTTRPTAWRPYTADRRSHPNRTDKPSKTGHHSQHGWPRYLSLR